MEISDDSLRCPEHARDSGLPVHIDAPASHQARGDGARVLVAHCDRGHSREAGGGV